MSALGKKYRLPAYATLLPRKADPVFITAEWAIARRIARAEGVCLVVDFNPRLADLSVISGRDTWVLWNIDEVAGRALAQYVSLVAGSGFLIKAEGLIHG